METSATNLIEAVDRERSKRQMSDRKFSNEVLGISPSYWCLLKAGKRTPTLNLLTLFMQKLPEVTPEVTIFIMKQGNNPGAGKNSGKTAAQNPRGIDKCMPTPGKRQKT